MFTWGPRGATASGPAPIEWVIGSDSESEAFLNVPAHSANDLIIAYAKGTGAFDVPVVPSGWTDIVSGGIQAGPFTLPIRFYCIRDTTNSIATLELPTNTANVAFMIYRNASGAGVTAITAEALGPTSAASPSLGSLTAGSWAIAGVDINQSSDITGPAGLTTRVARPIVEGGGTGLASDTNGVVSSYTGGDSFTWGTGAYVQTFAFEILNG